jgi:hypothetical protein
MNTQPELFTKGFRLLVPGLLLFLLSGGLRAQQFFTVDCTGATPGAFSSINAALQNTTPGSFILVTGPCNEHVSVYAQTNLNLGAYYGQTAAINGSITISNSSNIFLYGLNVTNPSGDGVQVWSSSVTLDSCTSNGSAGVGLDAGTMSDVMVNATGSFSHNAHGGIVAGGNALVSLNAWAGPIDVSNNGGPGIYASQANIATLGRTNVTNNVFGEQARIPVTVWISAAALTCNLALYTARTLFPGTNPAEHGCKKPRRSRSGPLASQT